MSKLEVTEAPAADPQEPSPEDDPLYAMFGKKKEVVKKMSCEVLTINDSNDPSYTHLALPYRVICRQRYKRAGTLQRLQFIKEIRKQELSQSKALNGVRIHREFVDPVLVPPNQKEIIKLTVKQQFKLEALMND